MISRPERCPAEECTTGDKLGSRKSLLYNNRTDYRIQKTENLQKKLQVFGFFCDKTLFLVIDWMNRVKKEVLVWVDLRIYKKIKNKKIVIKKEMEK